MNKMAASVMLIFLVLVLISCGDDAAVPRGSGFIEATEVMVSAEVAGQLKKLNFDEGQKIGAADTIALIDTTTFALRLAEAGARHQVSEMQRKTAQLQIEKAGLDIDLAEKEYNRISRLIKSGSANQQQYDQAESRLNQARLARKSADAALKAVIADMARIGAEIELLEKQLSDCHPIAPLSGTVVTTYVEAGELVGIGKPLIKIARLDSVWVKVYLPAGDLPRIKLGDKAEVDPEDGRAEPLTGNISWISPEAEFTPKNVQTKQARADLVYAVKITIPNREQILKIGMPVLVTIP